MHKILVVDDEQDLCEILQFNLETEGYDVEVAYSAEEALMLPLHTYDLILLDVMIPFVIPLTDHCKAFLF